MANRLNFKYTYRFHRFWIDKILVPFGGATKTAATEPPGKLSTHSEVVKSIFRSLIILLNCIKYYL